MNNEPPADEKTQREWAIEDAARESAVPAGEGPRCKCGEPYTTTMTDDYKPEGCTPTMCQHQVAGEGQDYEKELVAVLGVGVNRNEAAAQKLIAILRQRDQSHSRPDLEKRLAQWRNRAKLFRDAYEDKACEVTALTIQKLDLESLGDGAMRIQRDRARESSKRMIELATRNLRNRAESSDRLLGELAEKAQECFRRNLVRPVSYRQGEHAEEESDKDLATVAALREKLEEVKKVIE